MSTIHDTTPSHDLALALAIVMSEDACEAGVAASTVRRRAHHSGTTLSATATRIVTAGTNRQSEPDGLGDQGTLVIRDGKVNTVQRALLTLMRENACNDSDAAMTLRVRAAQHRLTILDIATSINELDDAS